MCRILVGGEVPIGMAGEFFVALVEAIKRLEECGGVAGVDENWQAEFAASGPDGVPAGVVDGDQRAVWVAIDEAQVFENLQAGGATLFRVGESGGHATGEVGALAIPGGGLVGLAVALPIDVGEDDEAIWVVGPEELLVLLEPFAEFAVKAHRDGDVLVVHQADVLGERFGRLTKFFPAMDVEVDGGELCAGGAMLGQDEHGAGLELVEREAFCFFLRLSFGCLSQRRKGAKQ